MSSNLAAPSLSRSNLRSWIGILGLFCLASVAQTVDSKKDGAPPSYLPVVNMRLLPDSAVGALTERIGHSSDRGSAKYGGAFRITCGFSHVNADDPIVFPGQVGRSHLHTYFGNTGTDAHTTAISLTSSGASTCSGGILNRSAYWVPSMIDTRDGRPIKPIELIVYYKVGHAAAANVVAPAKGLRMIAGDPQRRGPSANEEPTGVLGFQCEDGQTPSGRHLPQKCSNRAPWNPTLGYLRMTILFPQCWDGTNIDSPDHRSHMSYPTTSGCPSSHPHAIPEVTLNVQFPVREADETRHWRLSSDNYALSVPGGYSVHADWWNGWNESIMKDIVANCLHRVLDCPMGNLNDGRALH